MGVIHQQSRRRAPATTALRLVAAVLVASSWLIVATIFPVAAGEPDACAYIPTDFQVNQTPPSFLCSGVKYVGADGLSVTITAYQSPEFTRQTFAGVHSELERNTGLQVPIGADYGEVSFEADDEVGVTKIMFVKGQFLVLLSFSNDNFLGDARAYAAQIAASLPSGPTSVPTASPSPSPGPGASGGDLQLGLGCGTDLRFVRCTVSTYGQSPDADLEYEWSFDGSNRPETGSTMELDWVAEAVPTGNHVVIVAVRDRRSNAYGAAATSFDLGLSVTVSCSYQPGDDDYAVLCTATPRNAAATAVLEYDWTYDYLDGGGQRRNGADGSKDERFSRAFGRGAVTVTVVARDTANGLESSPASSTVLIDPVATLTEWLTLGQTADPQNVIDAIKGAAAGATVASIVAALGLGLGGGRGAAKAGGPTGAPGRAAPAGASGSGTATGTGGASGSGTATGTGGASGSGTATGTGGASGSGTATGTATGAATGDDPFGAAADVLAAHAGQLPPLTPANVEQWKALTGWPAGPEADAAFIRAVTNLAESGANPAQIFESLKDIAPTVRPDQGPP